MQDVTGESIILPLDRELQERLDWFIRLRWLAGSAILAGALLGPRLLRIPLPSASLSVVAFAVLLYNLVLYRYRSRFASTPQRLRSAIHAQIGLDWVALTCTIYLTGGIGSPASLSFVFHLIIGAILLSRRACYMLAGSASLLLGSLALLAAVRPSALQSALTWGSVVYPFNALELWAGLTLFYLVTAYLATSITGRLRQKEAALSQSKRALDRAYCEMESLYELGQMVNSTLKMNEVLSLIAENAARLLKGKASFLRLFDKSGKKLYIGGWYGLSQAYIDKGPVDVEKSLVDLEALRGGGTIQVLEVGEDSRFQYREEARREGLRSMLSCPIRAKNRTLGVIRVYTAELHVFSEQEQNLLMNLANLGAVAIQNAHSYSELAALDQERVWFARTTHHQLRAPLAAAHGSLEALPFAGPLNEKQTDLVSRAKRRIQDSFDMIRDLLDLAAAQRIGDAAPPAPVRFEDALRHVIETAREHARSKGLEFVQELKACDCTVAAEAADLERIFSNLLSNAVKYTCCGKITIGAYPLNGWLDAWVEDTGMGIAPDDVDKVYSGFFRSAAARASGEMGTGLGLSIVRHVVERLGGTISLTSEAGKGTRFTVRLPLAAS
jgi:signal transduction histidine kinase